MKKLGLWVVWFVVMACAPVAAQGHDGLPRLRTSAIAPGALVDLDTGHQMMLGARGAERADLVFDRDGVGFFLAPLRGGMEAQPGDESPRGEDWSEDRLRFVDRRSTPLVAFVRTDDGVARIEVTVANPYSVASASLRWVVVPPTDPIFLPAPGQVACSWRGEGRVLRVTWQGDRSRYLVTVRTGEAVRKEIVAAAAIDLEGLDPNGVHRIEVRSMVGGAVSLAGSAVQHGPRKPCERAVVDYQRRWYDTRGGLNLSAAEAAGEAAEVVFYLYGVYVPGGGVQKLGNGRDAFLSQGKLPDTGYLPSYGRLDEFDVLAVRLRDGRRGLLWLDPHDGQDVRGGMRVHTVFLPDGRGRVLASPNPSVRYEQGKPCLRWPAIAGAQSYRVVAAGGKPQIVRGCTVDQLNLASDRVHDVAVIAVAAAGERSAPRTVLVHTFGDIARHQTLELGTDGRGAHLATGKLAGARGERQPGDLAITNSAGGATSLSFRTPHGHALSEGRKFGDFTGVRRNPRTDFTSDSRDAGSDHFYVFTKDGGCASVRIIKRDSSNSILEYLWLPVPPK